MIRHLFIDPASYSTGWAVFENGELKRHGTIKAVSPVIGLRLVELYRSYLGFVVTDSLDNVTVERMNRLVHYYVIWSVAAILTAIFTKCPRISLNELSPSTWKRWLSENKLQLSSLKAVYTVASDDEAVAIAMGFAYYKKEGL